MYVLFRSYTTIGYSINSGFVSEKVSDQIYEINLEHIKKSMIKYRFGSIYYRSLMHVSVRGLTVNSPLLPLNSPHAQKFNVKSVKQIFAIIVVKYGIQINHVINSGLLRNVQK